jgi:hypothetical protein
LFGRRTRLATNIRDKSQLYHSQPEIGSKSDMNNSILFEKYLMMPQSPRISIKDRLHWIPMAGDIEDLKKEFAGIDIDYIDHRIKLYYNWIYYSSTFFLIDRRKPILQQCRL